jgi:hypothetical protein
VCVVRVLVRGKGGELTGGVGGLLAQAGGRDAFGNGVLDGGEFRDALAADVDAALRFGVGFLDAFDLLSEKL